MTGWFSKCVTKANTAFCQWSSSSRCCCFWRRKFWFFQIVNCICTFTFISKSYWTCYRYLYRWFFVCFTWATPRPIRTHVTAYKHMTCDCVTNTFSPKLSRSRYCHHNSAERKFCDVIMYNIAKSQEISPEVNKICARHQLCKKTPDPSQNHKNTADTTIS